MTTPTTAAPARNAVPDPQVRLDLFERCNIPVEELFEWPYLVARTTSSAPNGPVDVFHLNTTCHEVLESEHWPVEAEWVPVSDMTTVCPECTPSVDPTLATLLQVNDELIALKASLDATGPARYVAQHQIAVRLAMVLVSDEEIQAAISSLAAQVHAEVAEYLRSPQATADITAARPALEAALGVTIASVPGGAYFTWPGMMKDLTARGQSWAGNVPVLDALAMWLGSAPHAPVLSGFTWALTGDLLDYARAAYAHHEHARFDPFTDGESMEHAALTLTLVDAMPGDVPAQKFTQARAAAGAVLTAPLT